MILFRVLLPAALCVAVALPTAGTGVAPTPAASAVAVTAGLQRKLQYVLGQSTASTVAAAVDVAGLGQVYRARATTPVAPASTEKLFTTFAALKVLTPSRRLITQVRASQPRVGSRQPGNLYLVGGGDPFLTATDLNHLAAAVAASGIRTVSGRLLVDDFRYDQSRRAVGWKTSFVPAESGPLSALAVDHNGWRTDPAFLADPAVANLARFRTMLARHGVSVSTRIGHAQLPTGARLVASHASGPMTAVVRRIDKSSDNFAAELLLKEIGYMRRHVGTTAGGAAAVRDVLGPLGVAVGIVADGSGLSSRDRQSVAGELSLLLAAERSTMYRQLLQALPVACQDGTLKTRMCNTPAAGRARAKTGSLSSVRALAGWTSTADGHRVRFAFVLSGFRDAAKARQALDAATALLSAARVDS
ncbi:MAG: D-alanyl-D-alanine carboxypeptidase/D-alanyl-D-alanine-endopeptidase [Frankiales bacterium]|nr:D-alanyl-D-alanine carboxypeptidase/D-alanyl-D-alanine-endopeptidase [Frankiales bacterium]